MYDVSDAVWRKSSRSGSGGNCVEVANLSDATAVRDSKDPQGAVFAVDQGAWARFVTAIKAGQLRP